MKRLLTWMIAVVSLTCLPVPCEAQWGWPPPGYDTATGIRACDCAQYRGLKAVLRDWRQRKRGCYSPAVEAPSSPEPTTLPSDAGKLAPLPNPAKP